MYFKHAYVETNGIDRLIEKEAEYLRRHEEEQNKRLDTVMETVDETREE